MKCEFFFSWYQFNFFFLTCDSILHEFCNNFELELRHLLICVPHLEKREKFDRFDSKSIRASVSKSRSRVSVCVHRFISDCVSFRENTQVQITPWDVETSTPSW